MKYLAAAALAATCLAASAHAANDTVTYRVEVHGGWDRISVGSAFSGLLDSNDDGALYGIGIGIDVPLGATAFIGFEANADLSSVKDCGAIGGGVYCQKAKRDLSAITRVGTKISDGIKLYALGGYSNARIAESYSGLGGPLADASNAGGWRAGAGTEIRLGTSAYTKLEYRYSNYGSGYERHQIVAGLGLGL